METLTQYLEEILHQEPIKLKNNLCCYNKRNIVYSDMLVYTCAECGTMLFDVPNFKEVFETGKNPYVIKTYVNYHPKHRNIHRLHKWSNWSYAEVELRKLQDIIDSMDFPEGVKRLANIHLKHYYINRKIVSRSKIRMGLLCYCVYISYLTKKIDVDLNELFEMFDITINNYNQLIKKLNKEERLHYPRDLDKYYRLFDKKFDKNEIIRLYSEITNTDIKFNKKTILLSLINIALKDDVLFFSKKTISKTSINKVSSYIKNMKII